MTTKSSTGQQAEYVLITPEMATQMLAEDNKMNRRLRERTQREYAADMEEDNWDSLNGTTITYDTEGVLSDGQHRLRAIAESGHAQEYLVVRGVQPESRSTIDSNLRRSFSDDLAMNGEVNTNVKDTLLLAILTWDSQGGLANLRNVRFSRKMRSRLWPTYAAQINDTEQQSRRWMVRWQQFGGNTGAMQFMYWLLVHRTKCDVRAVDRFFQILAIGSQDPADEILVGCQGRLSTLGYIDNNMRRHPGRKNEEVWLLIRAWNDWLTGVPRSKGTYRLPQGGVADPYPMPTLAVAPEGR